MVFENMVPGNLVNAHELLKRYGRWSQDRFKKGHCLSYEWHYDPSRDPDNGEQEDAGLPPLQMAYDHEAIDIHRAVIRVPEKHRKFLFAVYVPQRLPFIAQARRLGIRTQDHHLFFEKGLTMFWNCYIKEGIRTVRST